jgi:hypothetical protein
MGGHQLLPVLLFAAALSATVLVPVIGHLCKVKFEGTGRKENSDLVF